jgi:hypothetical protein
MTPFQIQQSAPTLTRKSWAYLPSVSAFMPDNSNPPIGSVFFHGIPIINQFYGGRQTHEWHSSHVISKLVHRSKKPCGIFITILNAS